MKNRGFTLIEMVITLVVLGLIGAIGGMAISNGLLAYNATEDTMESLSKVRYAMERMAREIRQVRHTGLQYDFTAPLGLTNTAFIKSDGTQVTLNQTGANLEISYDSVAGSYTLADNISAFTLNYYQADGITAAAANNVAFVEIQLSMTHAGGNINQRTRVALRD